MLKKQNYYYLNDMWRDWDQDIVDSLISDVLEVTKKYLKSPTKKLKVIDVGCGSGAFSFALVDKVDKLVGIEPYPEAYSQLIANKRNKKVKLLVKKCLIEDYKTTEKFDLALSIATLEHMPNPEVSFRQIFRLLKPGGLIYLTVPNKLWPIEVHYHLPFLSWLPLPLANKYLQLSGLAQSYEDSSYAKTYWGIKSFFDKFPCTYSFHLPDTSSSYVGMGNKSFSYSLIKNIGINLISKWPFFWAFSKGFILVIQKNKKVI